VDLPPRKGRRIGLTLYIRRCRTRSLAPVRAGIDFDKKVRDLTGRRGQPRPPDSGRRSAWKATCAKEVSMNSSVTSRWLVPGTAGTAAGCGARTGNAYPTPARAKRTAPRNRCQPQEGYFEDIIEDGQACRPARLGRLKPAPRENMAESTSKNSQEEELQEKGEARRPYGHRAYPGHFNNTIVTIADLEGNTISWSSAGSLASAGRARDAVRRAAGGSDGRQQGRRERLRT